MPVMIQRRHFPPPWDIEEHNQSCYIVRDGNRQALAYVYFEAEAGRRTAAGPLTRDEARRIAAISARRTPRGVYQISLNKGRYVAPLFV